MTNATRTLLITFISLTALTALVKWTSGSDSSEAFESEIVSVDPAQVNKIQIEVPVEDRTINLKKGRLGWVVAGDDNAEGYAADSSVVQRALDQLTGLSVQSVVTRDPQKLTRYKADSTGTIVSLYNDDVQLSSLIVGSSRVVSRTEFINYVRPTDEEAVYSVEGLLDNTFRRGVKDWREKQVWDLDQDAITRIDFLFPADSSYSIERIGDQSWISRDDTLKNSKVNSILRRLSSLRVNSFVDSLAVSDFGTETYAIQLRVEDGKQRTIRLRPAASDDSHYIAVANSFPYTFTLNQSSWNNSVLKPRKELLK